jgi:hypothetical protein
MLFKNGESFSSIVRIISINEKVCYQTIKTVLKMNGLYKGYIVKKMERT